MGILKTQTVILVLLVKSTYFNQNPSVPADNNHKLLPLSLFYCNIVTYKKMFSVQSLVSNNTLHCIKIFKGKQKSSLKDYDFDEVNWICIECWFQSGMALSLRIGTFLIMGTTSLISTIEPGKKVSKFMFLVTWHSVTFFRSQDLLSFHSSQQQCDTGVHGIHS